MQVEQGILCKRLVEALHHQLRAVAIHGETRCAFLAAVEQAVAVGLLLVQLGQQRLASVEGGAQRLVERGHARRLGMGRARSLPEKRRLSAGVIL